MSRHVEFIESDSLVKHAAVLMGELDIGALPVGSSERRQLVWQIERELIEEDARPEIL